MRQVDYLTMAEGILGMLVELIKIMNGVFKNGDEKERGAIETLWLSDSLGLSHLESCIWRLMSLRIMGTFVHSVVRGC
jgi:hypothetical protein